MENKLEIKIIGTVASGKSTIMGIIQDALKNEGFNVTVKPGVDFGDNEFKFEEFKNYRRNEKIEGIKSKNTTIILETIQTQRVLPKVEEKENTNNH